MDCSIDSPRRDLDASAEQGKKSLIEDGSMLETGCRFVRSSRANLQPVTVAVHAWSFDAHGIILIAVMRQTNSNLIHVALYRPEIHPNAGNVARLCAANKIPLHLVGALGFRIDDRSVRRAGLDYWPHVDIRRESDLEELRSALPESRLFYFSARAEKLYTDVEYKPGDCLVFGPESQGFSEDLLSENREHALRIPMLTTNVRSLNLATAVGIAAYEALRQLAPYPSIQDTVLIQR